MLIILLKRKFFNQKSLFCTFVFLLATFTAGTATGALTLSGVNGAWSNTIGGVKINYPSNIAVSYGNGLENEVMWGEPFLPGHSQSGLGFTGVAPPASVFDVWEPFEIGQLRHFNNAIKLDSGATSTDLEISLSFSDPTGLTGTFNFTFQIYETSNATGPPESDDIITFPNFFPEETFSFNGIQYTLELLGFGLDADHLVSQLQSPEDSTNSTLLFGRISTSPAGPITTPINTTLILLGSGFACLSGIRRKFRKI